jgi:hypothetical protein
MVARILPPAGSPGPEASKSQRYSGTNLCQPSTAFKRGGIHHFPDPTQSASTSRMSHLIRGADAGGNTLQTRLRSDLLLKADADQSMAGQSNSRKKSRPFHRLCEAAEEDQAKANDKEQGGGGLELGQDERLQRLTLGRLNACWMWGLLADVRRWYCFRKAVPSGSFS